MLQWKKESAKKTLNPWLRIEVPQMLQKKEIKQQRAPTPNPCMYAVAGSLTGGFGIELQYCSDT